MSAMKEVHCFPRVRVGYEMVEGKEVLSAKLSFRRLFGHNHLVSNKCEWNNCFFLKRPQNNENSSHFIFVKTTDTQLVFNFEQARTITIFGEHGIMAQKP